MRGFAQGHRHHAFGLHVIVGRGRDGTPFYHSRDVGLNRGSWRHDVVGL